MVGRIGSYGSYGLSTPGGGTFAVSGGSGGGSSGGGGGSGAAGIVGAVVGGGLSLASSIVGFAGQNKALKGNLLLADAQARNDAAAAQNNYALAQLQMQQTKMTTAAQIQAAQLASGGSANTAVAIVASLTGVMLFGVGGFLLYKWAVK